MNGISYRQLFAVFGIITLVVASFVIGVNIFLKWAVDVESGKKEIPADLPAPQSMPNQTELTPTVIYDGGVFKPNRVLRDGGESIGCLVVLVNRSAAELKVGINPHDPAGDPGPDYGAIAPGDKLIFDPRFVGIKELAFHNHNNPKQEFTVEFGPECQL